MTINKEKVKTILFITLSNLGDIILTTPVLEKLRDVFPEARIDVITGEPGRDLFILHPAVRDVTVPRKRRTIWQRARQVMALRRKRYDMVVDLRNSLIPYLASPAFMNWKAFSGGGRMHKREEHLCKLEGFGIDAFSDTAFFIPVTADDRLKASEILGDKGKDNIVIINPGAKSHLKRWDAGKYAGIADRLISERGCRVLITGNEDDSEVVENVVSLMKNRAENICCKTPLGVLAEIMRRARLVITNDSAPLHVASAVNVPTIAIFGPSDEGKYGPLSEVSRVVKPGVDCRPCEKALCAVGPDEGCISQVTVDEVMDAAGEILGGRVMGKLTIKQGDITQENVDVIVNAANTKLAGGGGVDGAIHRAAGPTVLDECRKIGGCRTGEAVITGAGNLSAKKIIHTPGPVWRGGGSNEEELLRNSYRNSLGLAKENGLKSIAFPAISTGIYGYPLEEAAKIAIGEGLKNQADFEEIVYVCFSRGDYEVYRRVYEESCEL